MDKIFIGTGRRKSSVARVFIKNGEGKLTINGRTPEDFFPRKVYLEHIRQPLVSLNVGDSLDIKCFVKGGGTTGQSGAIRLGVAKALLSMDPEARESLRKGKLLTSDSRKVERKKYGQKGARARFQYSKR